MSDDDGIVDAEWARRAVSIIDDSIRQFNKDQGELPHMRVVWGGVDKINDDLTENATAPELRLQKGLLNLEDDDFQLMIFRPHNFTNDETGWIHITLVLATPQALPADPSRAATAIRAPFPPCRTILSELVIDGVNALSALGVSVTVPIDWITPFSLSDATEALIFAQEHLRSALQGSDDGP